MKVIIGCEESQEICNAFRKLGHEAYSCDILSCSGGHPEWHIKADVLTQLNAGWDLMIAHPSCIYLTVTGNKWFKPEYKKRFPNRERQREEAVLFFMKLINAPIEKIAVENPVGIMSTRYRKPDQIIQPYQFGHKEPKKTCLWLKSLPKLKPTKLVEPEYTLTKSCKRMPTWYHYADKSKGQAERSRIRSRTFPGIAKAMAEQWGTTGGLLSNN